MENKYQNSKIYSIKNTLNDEIYIGSTTVSLSQRMTKHRASLKCEKRGKCLLYQRMKELGVDNFYITLVEKYPCNDIEELRAKEGEWILKIGTLNQVVAGRKPEQYRKDNVEHKQEYDKEYHKQNKEKRSEQAHQRYEDNKEYIKQKNNQHYHQNKETLSISHKKYRDEHKEEINAKQNQRCQCECGMTYTKRNKARHLKSKHHQNFILNNNINNVSQTEEETNSQACSSTSVPSQSQSFYDV